MKNPIFLLLAIGFASCTTAPRARVVIEIPDREPDRELVQEAAVKDSGVPTAADDGLRMPDMLALPNEERLRSAAPSEGSGDATVITRPPAE